MAIGRMTMTLVIGHFKDVVTLRGNWKCGHVAVFN